MRAAPALQPHLCQCGVQLEYLALPLHLPHADLAGELGGRQAVPLQGEGAVKGPLAATPYVTEGDLLGKGGCGSRRQAQPALASGNEGGGGDGASAGRAGTLRGQLRPLHPTGQRKSWSRPLQLRKGRRRHKPECVSVCAPVCPGLGSQWTQWCPRQMGQRDVTIGGKCGLSARRGCSWGW